jgi:kynurenine formamidase
MISRRLSSGKKVDIRPGDAVFIRTGTLRYWGETGSDHEKLRAHDSAGINLEAAKWLVEQKGAILIGSDTSGLEVGPAPAGSRSFNPVHEYLLVEQGVHIGEFHSLGRACSRPRLRVLLRCVHEQD